MWKNWFLILIGLLLVVLGFSGFPAEMLKKIVIVAGLFIVFLSFKNVSRHKVNESVKHLPEEEEMEDQQESIT